MSTIDPHPGGVRAFVEGLDLSGVPAYRTKSAAPQAVPGVLVAGSLGESAVVGSDIISFMRGVTPERREAISNSALLAQLVASKRVPDSGQVEQWYDAYFDVLTNLGWVLQDRSFSAIESSSAQADVAVAVLEVAASLLGGPATAAYKLVQSTLDGLKKMYERSPWITLFERESHHATTARFQITLTHASEEDDFLVSTLAFSLEASSAFTQVLVFKFFQNQATLRHQSGSVSINDGLLQAIAPDIAAKVAAFTQGYIRSLPSLD